MSQTKRLRTEMKPNQKKKKTELIRIQLNFYYFNEARIIAGPQFIEKYVIMTIYFRAIWKSLCGGRADGRPGAAVRRLTASSIIIFACIQCVFIILLVCNI